MDIYILRHCQSVSNEQSIVCGAADYSLSTKGLEQAKKVCATLNQMQFDRIYCSPLTRVKQTIAHLSHPVDIIAVSELIELNTGKYSHITTDQLYSTDNRYRYQGLYPDLKYPDGECLNDMLSRVQTWFSNIFKEWQISESILIAGHEGTACAILHYLLELDIAHYPTFVVGNGECIHIKMNSDNQLRYRFVSLS